MSSVSRRTFLKVAGAAGIALATGCKVSPPSAGSGPSATLTPGVLPGIEIEGPPRELIVTPTGSLYVQSYDRVPRVEAEAWRLHIHGLVNHELNLSLEDIRAFPKLESMRTLECIGNPVGGPLIGNVVWGGIEAAAVWDQAGIRPEAGRARFAAGGDAELPGDGGGVPRADG